MSVEGIALENVCAAPQTDINSSTLSRPRHAVFHSFLSDDSKHDDATNTTHRKRLISLLKNKQVLTISLSTIWENSDGCAEQYIFASALYLMSVMSQTYCIIIDKGIRAPGSGKEVVDGPNAVDKLYIYQFMSKVQLPGSVRFDSQIKIHTGTENKDVSLVKEFKDHLEGEHLQNGSIDQGRSRKRSMKRKWTERNYHVQDNASVELKDVKIYCNTNQSQHYPSVVHIPNFMVQRGLASIIICYLIQNSVKIYNFPYTMCVCFLYINAGQSMDIRYTIR